MVKVRSQIIIIILKYICHTVTPVNKSASSEEAQKIKRLNEASEEIVNSYGSLQKEMHSEHEKDEDCKKLKSKMDTVIQSCANQHMVSKEVFTEKH